MTTRLLMARAAPRWPGFFSADGLAAMLRIQERTSVRTPSELEHAA